MDKPRHPHVVRTWVVERTRHPVHTVPPRKNEDPRRPPVHGVPQPAKSKKPDTKTPPEPAP